jgi:hypothetical protein
MARRIRRTHRAASFMGARWSPLKSATGEAFEIERTADQIAALIEELAAIDPPEAPAEPADEAAKPKARSKKNA